MKKLLLLFIAFLIVGCPPVIDNGDTTDMDTTATDSIPVDTTITDTTFIDTTVIDTPFTDTTVTDTAEDNKPTKSIYQKDHYESKMYTYEVFTWKCPNCSHRHYTDWDFSKIVVEGKPTQKFNRQCLGCLKRYEIKRRKGYYKIKEL